MSLLSCLLQKAYGVLTAVCLFSVLSPSAVLTFAGPVEAADTSDFRETALQRASNEQLHRDPYWHTLLHYKPRGAEHPTSLIDDPSFFLAPNGKTNPAAELAATINGIFSTEKDGDDAVACWFPARTEWLRSRLQIGEEQVPSVSCNRLNEALAAADPRRAVLVFPSSHINSPASMFGHTLLRIDNGYQSELLSYSVSYAAVSTETNGVAYAFKGIFGLYPGRYSILPYYEKVKEYNDIEHRDIWEYHLNLTKEEIRRMVLHVWEVQRTASDYFFFDENCAYNLLFFLEAARPSANLTDTFSLWVIPSDTIRAVREAGFVSDARYRPSQGTRIRFIASQLPIEDQVLAREIGEGRRAPNAVTNSSRLAKKQGRALDLAAELLQYRYARGDVGKEEFNRQFHAVLKERSGLSNSAGVAPSVPVPVRPDEGHGTGRAGIAAGVRQGRFFSEISGRFAYHDTMDPDEGYIMGAQINFADAAVRVYPEDEHVQLQRLHFIDILSLSPRNLFFQPLSWKINTGFDQEVLDDGDEHLVFRVNTGGGFVSALGTDGLAFLLAETDLLLAEKLVDHYGVGIGGSIGLFGHITARWKGGLTLSGFYYPIAEEHARLQTTLVQNYSISHNQTLQVALKGERTFGFGRYELKAGWNLFF